MTPPDRQPLHWIGVLLAAGRGRRMGTTKQLLPWPAPGGERPLVAAAYDAIASACAEMIVVLGHEAGAVAEALGDRPFRMVAGDADEPMFESVRRGLRAARNLDPGAGVLLHPADHPAVAPATLARLLDEATRNPEKAIMPVHDGCGGHPVLIPPALVRVLVEHHGAGGVRQYWTDHPDA
jgi:molybdenum cofactor cytidylyltransferase